MSENVRVTKAAGVVGAATLISRIFGFIRDVVIAWFFGAGLAADAFFVAFRIPNLLRRLFAEGSLSIAFIPVFTEYLANKGKADAFSLARSAIRCLSVLLVFVTIAGILLAPLIVRIIAPGFVDSPEKLSLTITLTRIIFPYIFFICLVALCMGILNALGHFAAPAFAPVLLNLAMICSVFLISPYMADPVTGLAIGVLIGGVLQLALQMPFLMKKGFYFWQKTKVYHPGLKKIGILMLPTVFGAAVYQINILVGTLLASLLREGSISYLYYADRLVQFPLGIFAIAIATAVLPSLSRQAAINDLEGVKDTFGHAMKLVLFITVPAMAGLIVLREPIVALLFKRGAFDAETVRLTASALLYYATGLWAFSGVRIVISTFYALQDTKTPVKIAVISISVNILLGLILMGPLAHGGLALSTSLASMLNLGLLIRALKIKLGYLGMRNIMKSACKTVLCSAIMGVIVSGVASLIIPSENGSLSGLFFGIMVSIIIGILLYGSFSFLIKSPELEKVKAVIIKGICKK
ncbi:MAG: murein biosynthesis integral membrane protein MurJ [Deltaproteobacteria bacterium]|nr:murein biosynthesis integral membrane protein MurJ [Deltaproteobacteria bacterium]MBW2663010.1 murein biosynthesis integral membrane protein MurJ [Deltaproteobacteria bacterium]